MYHKGKFKPLNPEKYIGDPTQIIYRSSWERKFMAWCDRSNSVLKWQSEETVIPYRCPTDNRIHRYFVDFRIQIRDKQGVLKTYLVEVKPDSQTRPPVYPGKKTQKYLTEALTFMKNRAKWDAAEQFAKDRGWSFIILTEHHLGV